MTKSLGFKNKVLHRFEINTLKDYGKKAVYRRGKKPSKPKNTESTQRRYN